jgi:hypothetical protein
MITYQLKHTNPAQVKLNNDGSATITQGFTTGVVGTPDSYGMVAGDTLIIPIANYANKTVSQVNTEVITAVTAFIASKYPST